MSDSKEIDMSLFSKSSTIDDKICGWIDDHNPFPYRWRFWFNDKDIFHPTRIYRKISNIVRWIPILWNDVDWDYASLYRVLHQKIKFMRVTHEQYHHHTDWEEVVVQMKTAEDCLFRLLKDNYAEKEWSAYHEKFPRGDRWIKLADGGRQMESISEEQSDQMRKTFELEESLKQRDLETFASTFVQHVRGWWD